MNTFTIVTGLIAISALFSYINARLLKLPGTIGVIMIAIVASLVILVSGKSFLGIAEFVTEITTRIDFSKALLDVMLAFLLFASALHFDFQKLKAQIWPVLILSTISVVGSTFIFGGLLYWVISGLFHIPIPFIYCLIFGAVVSPTDPVAVSAVLKKSRIPSHLETIISGESLFNDGMGLILFITLVEIADPLNNGLSFSHTGGLFAVEVFGGIAIGVVLGYIALRLMKTVSDLQTIVLISLALVMGLSVIASLIHVSIPLSVVCAGLIIGDQPLGKRNVPGKTDEYLEGVWKLIDELLNTVLFVMIGLQLVILPFLRNHWLSGLMACGILLFARAMSILIPLIFLRRSLKIKYNSVVVLTWAGLRGGISIALALSLPESDYKELILAGSYFIVIFSIIVQGLTLNKVVNAFTK